MPTPSNPIRLLIPLYICIISQLQPSTPKIIPFTPKAIQTIFQGRTPTLFLFSGNNTESQIAKEVFTQLDQYGVDDVLLSISDAHDGFQMFQRLADYLDIDCQYTPQILVFGEHQEKYYFQGPEINMHALLEFIRKVTNNQIQPYIKSALPPAENPGPVYVAVGSTFKKMVLNSQKQILVDFYAPECDHCNKLSPIFQQAAHRLSKNKNLMFVKIDCSVNQIIDMEIQGFPAIKFYARDRSRGPISYTGGVQKSDEIIRWLKKHVHYEWVEPLKRGKIVETDEIQTKNGNNYNNIDKQSIVQL